jgi:succinate dehydrogenase / fumarate reductase flavoprotein subunit
MGVPFSRTAEGKIAQRNFGGHTRDFGKKPVRRACYAADRTGRVVLDTLYDQCLRHQVKIYPEHYVLSLILEEGQCKGVVTYDLATGELRSLYSKAVLLATGGLGKIYKTTSNGFANTGDGFHLRLPTGILLRTWNSFSFIDPDFILWEYWWRAAREKEASFETDWGSALWKNMLPP